jgi:hypothetical protein
MQHEAILKQSIQSLTRWRRIFLILFDQFLRFSMPTKHKNHVKNATENKSQTLTSRTLTRNGLFSVFFNVLCPPPTWGVDLYWLQGFRVNTLPPAIFSPPESTEGCFIVAPVTRVRIPPGKLETTK